MKTILRIFLTKFMSNTDNDMYTVNYRLNIVSNNMPVITESISYIDEARSTYNLLYKGPPSIKGGPKFKSFDQYLEYHISEYGKTTRIQRVKYKSKFI